jgi:hypothetical protein
MAASGISFLSKLSRYVYRYSSVPVQWKDRKGYDALQSIIKTTIVLDLFMSLWFKVPEW